MHHRKTNKAQRRNNENSVAVIRELGVIFHIETSDTDLNENYLHLKFLLNPFVNESGLRKLNDK